MNLNKKKTKNLNCRSIGHVWSHAVFEQAAFALAFEVLSLSFTFTFSVYGAGLNTQVISVSSLVRADRY